MTPARPQTDANGPVAWLAIVAVTCLFLYFCQGILWLVIPLLLSVIVYYLTRPIVTRLVRRGYTLPMAVNMVTFMLVIVLGAFACWFFPAFASHLEDLHQSTDRYIEGGLRLVDSTVTDASAAFPFAQEAADVIDDRPWQDQLASVAQHYVGDALLEILHWIPSLLLVPYLTYFLLLDGARLKRFIVRAIPNAYFEKTLLLFHRVDAQVQAYFQGLMGLTVLDAVSLFAGLLLLGFQAELSLTGLLLFSLFLAVLSWLPYVGSILGAVLLVLVAATDFPGNDWMAYGAIIMFLIVRMLDDFLYMPLTVGRSLNVHPVVMVLMIFVGGEIAGISGLLLVMPVLGVVMVCCEVLGHILTDDRLRARHAHARRLQRARAAEGL